jgi:peptidoglycan hydrolase-like protein with peptidoglycan-binding domain
MTQTNTFAGKLGVAFVAIAMSLMMFAPAQAQTSEELQAQIDSLMATITALQSQLGVAVTTTASADAYVFTRSLTIGAQGADVTALQNYLIAAGFSIPAGATGYFGTQTQAAVASWQSAQGVTPAVGYFGPLSQARYMQLTAAAAPADDSDDDDSSDDDSDVSLSGEASLKSVDISNGDDQNDVEEGASDLEVAEIEVEFTDGDAEITRLDIVLDDGTVANTETDPWRVFEDISLMVDGDVVETVDASDRDNYLDEDEGSIRFSGLNIVGMEDESVTIVVVASIAGSVDSTGSATLADWDIYAAELRYVDADGVTTTDSDTDELEDGSNTSVSGDSAGFTIDAAGASDDLNLEDSDANPDTGTLQLSSNDNTEEAIFAFDLSADDSDGDVVLDNLVSVTVTVATTAASVGDDMDNLVSDFRLEIDGTSYDAESYTGSGLTATIDFDINGDETIAEGETVTAVLYADFNEMATADEGSSIFASVATAAIDAEGEESGETITVDGSTITGNTLTLRTTGVDVQYVSDSVSADENSDATTTDNAADFTLKFTVEAFDDTVYLPFGANSSTTIMTDGVGYSIVDTNTNTIVTTGTKVAGVTSSADTEDNSFKVAGSAETFTLTVNFDPAASGSYMLRLDTIHYKTSDAATADTTQDVAALDIQTDAKTISH